MIDALQYQKRMYHLVGIISKWKMHATLTEAMIKIHHSHQELHTHMKEKVKKSFCRELI
jgi:hypothetical protein